MIIQKETLETKDNMATKINMDRYVWEGWTVGAFIRELAPQVEMIMSGQSWRVSLEPFYKISQDIKYHVISYLSLSFINLNIS